MNMKTIWIIEKIDPKEEEDTIWKIRSEKRKFEEEKERFGVENAEWSKQRSWERRTGIHGELKNKELEYYKLKLYMDSTWIIFVCHL